MISGAVCTLVLFIAVARITAAKKNVWENSTFREVEDLPWRVSLNRYPSHGLLATARTLRLGDRKTIVSLDKKIKSKVTLDNTTGLRKTIDHHGNRLPTSVLVEHSSTNEYSNSQKLLQDRNHLQSALVSSHFLSTKISSMQEQRDTKTIIYSFLDHESNRPESDSKERICLSECHKERDEREAYCNSDFAVNGIIHDVDTLSKGTQLLTILVNSGGLYKMNRLYITPDGFFFRVKILAVDNLNCHKSCLDFKLGSRYIIMGQIYHKRMELPLSMQQTISGRLRAGDGLVTSGSNFVKRFNRKKERKVLAAMHSKCQ
ncbi:UPF0450 protein C17orf58 homolog isoform X2 [Pseudophryne corroboree]|uniref:UPF0450 protein C17orf58 homolog isoform X2 n=1 Tax=Pseudophryne corroboree TaxID=495146 RepID=UPI003081D602